jgi:hypothetical protein
LQTPHEVLLDRLYRMVTVSAAVAKLPLEPGYSLTADNVLKMAMIYLRVESGTPAVIMGETGARATAALDFRCLPVFPLRPCPPHCPHLTRCPQAAARRAWCTTWRA